EQLEHGVVTGLLRRIGGLGPGRGLAEQDRELAVAQDPGQPRFATRRAEADRRVALDGAGAAEPVEVPPQHRRLAGDGAPGVAPRVEERQVATQGATIHLLRALQAEPATPRDERPQVSP